MSETKAKEQKVSKSIAQEASDDQAYQTDMHYARKEITIKRTYHCENCNVKFPVEDERFGLCRECNEDNGFCYECEKKENKMSHTSEMLVEIKSIREWLLNFRDSVSFENQIKLTNRSIRLTDLIIEVEEGK